MLNPIVNSHIDVQAQKIFDDIIIESIQCFGTDWYFLPRKMLSVDKLLREDVHSEFSRAYVIEGYLSNLDEFKNDEALLSRAGFRIGVTGNLVISKTRFDEVVKPVNNNAMSGTIPFVPSGSRTLNGLLGGTLPAMVSDFDDTVIIFPVEDPNIITRPFEGDLVYSPLYKTVFEIKRVQHERPFYELEQLPIYELSIVKWEYNHDIMRTNIPDVDRIQHKFAFSIVVKYSNMIGSFAVGDRVEQVMTTGDIVSGTVSEVDLTNKLITITDITSTSQSINKFIVSSTSLLQNQDSQACRLTKIYQVDGSLSDTESKLVFKHDKVAINQDVEKDKKNYINSKADNPYW